MTRKLYKDGITVELAFDTDVTMYKSRGFVEVKEVQEATNDEPEQAVQKTPKKPAQRKKAGE